ncbi:MAG: aminotransferase class IV [Bacteroidales bacterium]|jgi:4-amino-4-deoxychorismate lyase|nr:aminotransferase class IV [Bacteroidales bacterium]
MCLLLETIRIESGRIGNIRYHQERMNRARQELFKCSGLLDLDKTIRTYACSAGFAIRPQSALNLQSVPEEQKKRHKCRITYARDIETVEFLPYRLPTINSLKIVIDDEIDYVFKFHDRSRIHTLFEKRDKSDDILIVKQGFITDTSYANVLFYNGKEWLTPSYPLLKGTQRASLLDQEIIRVAEIRLEDLHHFKKVRLINAMIRFEDELDINILNIQY